MFLMGWMADVFCARECAGVGVKHRACRKRRSAAPSPR